VCNGMKNILVVHWIPWTCFALAPNTRCREGGCWRSLNERSLHLAIPIKIQKMQLVICSSMSSRMTLSEERTVIRHEYHYYAVFVV